MCGGNSFSSCLLSNLKLPVVLARFPKKIAMSARLWGTKEMCPARYKKARLKPVCVSQMMASDC